MSDSNLIRTSLFAVYDLAIKNWCIKLVRNVTDQGLVVMASPMRAFSEARRVLERMTPSDQEIIYGADKVANLPLPLITFQRGSISARDFGRTVRLPLFNTTHYDESARTIKTAIPPIPLWIEYSIDIWSKTFNVQSQLVTEFISAFDPYLSYTLAEFGHEIGNYMAPLRFGDMDDVSELEGDELDDRVIRHTLSLKVEAWKFFVPDVALTALSTHLDIQDHTTQSRPIIIKNRMYPCVYIQHSRGAWYKLISINKGEADLVPVSKMPDASELEIYMDNDDIIMPEGLVMVDSIHNIPFNFKCNPINADLVPSYFPNSFELSKPLVIQKSQRFYIKNRRDYYSQLIARNFHVSMKNKFVVPSEGTPVV